MIYEVNCVVPEHRRGEFLSWLKVHVRQLLNLDGFNDAVISELQEDDRLPEYCAGFCVQYCLEGRDVFERYLAEYAPDMRADGIQRFGDDLKIYRRLMSKPLFTGR